MRSASGTNHPLIALVVLLALGLAACGGAPAAQPTAAPAAPTSAPAAPTPTFEPVTDVEPTVGAEPTAVPPTAAPAASGALVWRDQILRNDAVVVSVNGLPPAADGEVYAAWLAGADSSLALGPLADTGGALSLTYVSPAQANLLGDYDSVYIARAAADATEAAPDDVVAGGTLPAQALVHLRHVLVSIDATPAKLGFALGLRQETDELLRHAQFLRDAQAAGDLPLVKVHAEHIANIIEGSGAHDLNGDGKVQNPGDGFGLLPNGEQDGYIAGMVNHARLAGESADATDGIVLHAGHVQIAGENTRARVEQLHELAEGIAAAPGLAESEKDVLTVLALAQQAIQGIDANLDEQVGPVPGEGGVLTAYQHAQLMAGITLGAPLAAAAPPPAPAPEAGPAPVAVEVRDNAFSPNKITVPVGATVVWTSAGQRPHTVTADDSSFDSGTLNGGGTFSQTFDTPGTFSYYCTFHGGRGGEGMAGAVIVAAQSAAAPSAPTAAPIAAPAAPAPPAPAPSGESAVAVGDNTFTPQEIRVPVGATVVWTSAGQRPHTVTADDGAFDSGRLESGGAFSQTFDAPGVYPYYCEFHGGPGGQAMAGVVAVGDGAAAPAPTAAPTATPVPTAAPAAAPPAAAAVSMQDFAFAPGEITVKVGTTVTWSNDGARQHSATAVDGSFNTGLYPAGESRSATFDTPGTFVYFCELHGAPDGSSGMVGRVVVEP